MKLLAYVSNYQRIKDEVSTPEEAYEYAKTFNLPELSATEQKDYLVGFANLVKRSVMDEIGGLDEDYPLGNYEDNDFGIRVLQSGHQNVLLHNVFIFHWGSKSFVHNEVDYSITMSENAELFKKKWGFSPDYYGC